MCAVGFTRHKTSLMQTALHDSVDMVQISNIAHTVEGLVIGSAAILAVAESTFLTRRPGQKAQLIWPLIIFLAGTFLLAYLTVPHHGLNHTVDQWRFIWNDSQQRQHLLMSVIMLLGAGAELVVRRGTPPGGDRLLRSSPLSFGWPAALLLVGIMFLTHPQHGTTEAVQRATIIHRWLGAVLVASGLARTGELFARENRILRTLWPILLLIASILLFMYREPPGAYAPGSANHSGKH